MVRGLGQQKGFQMARIGTFTRGEDGIYAGVIRTLMLDVPAFLVPVEGGSEKAPDLRLRIGDVEIGAAWKRLSQDQREYYSAKIDDPSFPSPIFANLVQSGEEFALIWSPLTSPSGAGRKLRAVPILRYCSGNGGYGELSRR
jgi:uncharacterized protein (DUF736 family)